MEHLEQVAGIDLTPRADIFFGARDVASMIKRYKPMFLKHWEEVAVYKDVRPLDPNWDAYLSAARAGRIVCYTALDVTRNEVVGYSVYLISPSLHYKTWISATNDIYYVDPSYRRAPGFWLAHALFSGADDWLKHTHGVRSIRYPVKAHLDHSAVFKELGYTKVEDIYERLT